MNITVTYKDFLDYLIGNKDYSIVDKQLAEKLIACNEVEKLTHIQEESEGLYKVWHPTVWRSGRIKALLEMEAVRKKIEIANKILADISHKHNKDGIIPAGIWKLMITKIFENKIVAVKQYEISEEDYEYVNWYLHHYKKLS